MQDSVRILDIGCAENKTKSFADEVVGLDIFKSPSVDVIWDLERTPLPFKDEEFDMIVANSVLEHIDNLPELVEDLWRITKKEGMIKIKVPYFKSWGACSIFHRNYWNTCMFDFFTCGLTPDHMPRFKVLRKGVRYASYKFLNRVLDSIANANLGFYEKVMSNLIPANEVYFELGKVA